MAFDVLPLIVDELRGDMHMAWNALQEPGGVISTIASDIAWAGARRVQ
jgi:hypothetical protein